MSSTPTSSAVRRRLCALAVLVCLAASCSNAASHSAGSTSTVSSAHAVTSSAPGVTSTEIRFSVLGTRSNNPLGTCVLDCYLDGVKAYFAWRNSQGGLFGRKLVVPSADVYDDELSQDQAKAVQIVSADDTFATFTATELATGWSDLAKAGIPTYVWGVNPAQENGLDDIFGHREVFCPTCSVRWYPYVAKLAHATKVASLGYGVAQSSKDCVSGATASFRTYGKDVGAKMVYVDDALAFGLPNGIGPEVSAMKAAGVNMIVGCLDLNGMKTLAQELARQGMSHVVLLHNNTYDQQFVKAAGSLFDGDYMLVEFRPFEADAGDSTLTDFEQWMAKARTPITEVGMVGWINADEAYQGIKAAGPAFTRASVIAATNRMTHYTAGGLVQPIDWTRQHVAMSDADPTAHGPKDDCIALVTVVDGTFHLVGDRSKPWICWPGNTTAWSEPEHMDFH